MCILTTYVLCMFYAVCMYICILQNIAKVVLVYGARSMHSIGLVQAAYDAVFPAVNNLNNWRLRVVLNILTIAILCLLLNIICMQTVSDMI